MRRRRRGAGVGNNLKLICDTAGIAYIASTQAYGEWTFDLYKGADANLSSVNIIDSDIDAGGDGYSYIIQNTEAIGINITAVDVVMRTVVSYVLINTWYSVKITRAAGGIFTLYIKGGTFGNSWVLVDVTGGTGTNPKTQNTYTASAYLVLDLDAGDKIRRINAGTHLDVRDFTVSTGEYHVSA